MTWNRGWLIQRGTFFSSDVRIVDKMPLSHHTVKRSVTEVWKPQSWMQVHTFRDTRRNQNISSSTNNYLSYDQYTKSDSVKDKLEFSERLTTNALCVVLFTTPRSFLMDKQLQQPLSTWRRPHDNGDLFWVQGSHKTGGTSLHVGATSCIMWSEHSSINSTSVPSSSLLVKSRKVIKQNKATERRNMNALWKTEIR